MDELIALRSKIEDEYRALQLSIALVGGLRYPNGVGRETVLLQLRSQAQTLVEMRNINERMLRVGLGERSVEDEVSKTGIFESARNFLSESAASWIKVGIALLVLLFGDGWIKKRARALREHLHKIYLKQRSNESSPSSIETGLASPASPQIEPAGGVGATLASGELVSVPDKAPK